MKIFINGEAFELAIKTPEQPLSILDALTEYFLAVTPEKQFALALNGNFIASCDYSEFSLNDGDSLDVFTPIQGG